MCEEHISQKAWRNASFWPGPLLPASRGGWRRHGTYERKRPAGLRIGRWYNRDQHVTVSLIPDFAAARVSSSLAEIEDVAMEVERARARGMSVERIAGALRRDIELPGAMRWVRRRVHWVDVALRTLKGLAADKLAGCALIVEAFRLRLGTGCVVVRAREMAAGNIARFPAPVGFAPLSKNYQRRRDRAQHETGPDPPTTPS